MSIDVFPMSVLNATLWNGQSMPLPIVGGGTGATTAATARTNLGLGTMAQQDAGAVAITGGSGHFTLGVNSLDFTGNGATGFYTTLEAAGGTSRYAFFAQGSAPSYLAGPLLLASATQQTSARLEVNYAQTTPNGIVFLPNNDTPAGGAACLFLNAAKAVVGYISANGTTTTYGTSSDARLKHAITDLSDTAALAVLAELRPVSFRWNADDSPGVGFLAHELQQVIADAVSGEPDAVNLDGSVRPQQVDHSKLVPWLTSALQEAVALTQALAARVQVLEDEIGL